MRQGDCSTRDSYRVRAHAAILGRPWPMSASMDIRWRCIVTGIASTTRKIQRPCSLSEPSRRWVVSSRFWPGRPRPKDGLVKALRLAGIKTIKGANGYLKRFMADYNKRFSKPPRHEADVHQALSWDVETLRLITSEKYERKLSKSLSCYKGRQYLIQTKGRQDYHLRGVTVTVCDDGDEVPVVCCIGISLCPTGALNSMSW